MSKTGEVKQTAEPRIQPMTYSRQHDSSVRVRASRAIELSPGIWEITIPSAELTEAQRGVLKGLFPNTLDRVYQLLDREILINSIIDD